MREGDFIEALSRIHGNTPYLADAETVPFEGTFLLLSVDSFSEREDFLSSLPPEAIGRQMARAACSDLLACGAMPEFLLQNWCYDSSHDIEFYLKIANGIESVLKHYGTQCIGGDVGTASEWCWTATTFGRSQSPVTRVASSKVPFDLYTTGLFGMANAAVFRGLPQPELPLRHPVPQGTLFATDSSGGLFDALENFRRVNRGMHIEIDADKAISAAARNSLPHEAEAGWMLVGGVGEYELIFAVPTGTPCPNAVRIGGGYFRDSQENDFRIACGGRHGTMVSPPPDYREIAREEWVAATARYWESLFE